MWPETACGVALCHLVRPTQTPPVGTHADGSDSLQNESHNIDACVQSARLLGGEILIADSGSTDGTLEIVAGMSDCRLIERAFIDYADFRTGRFLRPVNPGCLCSTRTNASPNRWPTKFCTFWPPTLATSTLIGWPGARFFWGTKRGLDRGGGMESIDSSGATTVVMHRVACTNHYKVAPGRRGRLRNQLLHYSINSYDEYFAKHVNYTRWSAADLWDRGQRSSMWRMLARPAFRFLWLYLVRGGFLDGAVGLQLCMLQSFFVTMVKQGRLWEMEHGRMSTMTTIKPRSCRFQPGNIAPPERDSAGRLPKPDSAILWP